MRTFISASVSGFPPRWGHDDKEDEQGSEQNPDVIGGTNELERLHIFSSLSGHVLARWEPTKTSGNLQTRLTIYRITSYFSRSVVELGASD